MDFELIPAKIKLYPASVFHFFTARAIHQWNKICNDAIIVKHTFFYLPHKKIQNNYSEFGMCKIKTWQICAFAMNFFRAIAGNAAG